MNQFLLQTIEILTRNFQKVLVIVLFSFLEIFVTFETPTQKL